AWTVEALEDEDEEARPKLTDQERNRITLAFTRIQRQLDVIRVFRDNKEIFHERIGAEVEIVTKKGEEKTVVLEEETFLTIESIQRRIVFAGIDFSERPTTTFPTILVPILSFLFAAGQMIIMQKIQKKTAPEAVAQMGSMKYMFYFMPIMSLVIAFQFPAGAGFYWAVSAAVGIVQSIIIYKVWPPERLRAEVEEALAKRGINLDNVVVIEKSDGRIIEKKAADMSGKEEKEYYRKKLEDARKADLEKYGEIPEGENNNDGENGKD
ncbi:MAG: YidC/Oxa1 family membrane protein insertase, partial [Oscillospiraceae bacterium]|nr:YidC/Oxa1 family membrane protein insertase [Oscillospiraceae bacterium]